MEQAEINKKVKNGSYYQDAYKWYENRYISPYGERVWVFIATTISLLSFIFLFITITNIWNNTEEVPIIIETENSTDYLSIIKPLADKENNTQEAVTSYLLSYYVKLRENYDPTKINSSELKLDARKVRSVSAKNVLNEYLSYMNKNNPYSPLRRFGRTTSRNVEITKINFINNSPESGKANVEFKAITRTGNNKPKTELWQSEIQYRIPDVKLVAHSGAPLRFVVRYYRANKINK